MGSTADKNAMGFWFTSTATSGDSRGLYLRQYFSGAGGSGEAAPIYGTVNNVQAAVGGTVNGAHITLSASGASGSISGAGNALRATLAIGASCNPGGTLSGIQIDSDFDNTGTVPATAACLRVTNSNTKLWKNLMVIPAPTADDILGTHTTQVMSHSIRILDSAGTPYYIMCASVLGDRQV